MYHGIGEGVNREPGSGLYSVSEEDFLRQMRYISGRGTQEFIVTFDDGLISNYDLAFGVLKRLGLTGCFFVIASRVGRAGYMSWEQLKEIEDAGMVVGSHGMTHCILCGMDDKGLDYEFKTSRSILEQKLGHLVDAVSIPRGFYNRRVLDAAADAGYKFIFTSDMNDISDSVLGRVAVKANWDLDHFIQVLDKGFCFNDRVREFIVSSSKKILGAGNYDRLRSVILR